MVGFIEKIPLSLVEHPVGGRSQEESTYEVFISLIFFLG
jgi:hypothetical protein